MRKSHNYGNKNVEVIYISIKSIRLARKLTQKELADKLHVEQSAVAKWENGKCGPKRNRLIEIAKVLECPIAELLDEDSI